MPNSKEDIFDWLESSVKTIQEKFATRENGPVYFNDFDKNVPDVWVQLYPGCDIMITDRSADRFIIHCRMLAGVVLPIHHHPDYTETFTVIRGCISDMVSFQILTPDSKPLLFDRNISHAIKCEEDALMIIECIRV